MRPIMVNRLSLNIDKTNYILFHPYNKPIKRQITLKSNKKAIIEKNSIKYLGVMIDSTLTWHSQVDNISKKISRAIGLLYKIRPFVGKKVMKTLYYVLIYPHLIYAIEVWGSADQSIINRMFVLQKRAVRLITYSDIRQENFSFTASTPLFYNEKFLKIQDIFKMRILKFIYCCLNKSLPISFHAWFKVTSDIHNYSTRSKFIDLDNSITTNNLFIPRARTSYYGLKQIKVQGPKLWNIISPVIRNSTSCESFVFQLKKSMIDNYNLNF